VSDFPATEQEALQPLDPQAAAELAQELTLVSRAMFAQLLPDTARSAVAGISSPVGAAHGLPVDTGSPAPVAAPAAPPVAPTPDPVVSVPLPSLPVPLPMPVAAPTPRIPVQPGAAAGPGHIPMTPVMPVGAGTGAEAKTDADEVAPVRIAPKPAPRTMAMLEEITFLDE
jgi:hypothetical protein